MTAELIIAALGLGLSIMVNCVLVAAFLGGVRSDIAQLKGWMDSMGPKISDTRETVAALKIRVGMWSEN